MLCKRRSLILALLMNRVAAISSAASSSSRCFLACFLATLVAASSPAFAIYANQLPETAGWQIRHLMGASLERLRGLSYGFPYHSLLISRLCVCSYNLQLGARTRSRTLHLQSHRRQTLNPLCAAFSERSELPGLFDDLPVADRNEDDFSDDGDDDGQDIPIGGALFDEGGGEQDADMIDEDELAGQEQGDEEDEEEDPAGNIDYEDGPGWEPPPLPPPAVPIVDAEAPQAPAPAGRQHIEESLRQDVYIDHFPSARAGKPLRQEASSFSSYGAAEADNPYAPFPTRMDWEIARWGKIFGPGSNAMDRLLAIQGVPEALGLSYHTTRQINQVIDKLPVSRPRFHCKEVTVGGEAFEVYYRDSLECVKALYGDPSLAADLIFKSERHYTDADRTNRMYHDMHTGTWWWNAQVHTLITIQQERIQSVSTYKMVKLNPN
ncbi:hypothetical protein EUX98_g7528 [Antrodiella citrinella]|uniref:Uncharacterized protein n=1 Tax=Antrodiella citrinella TaxID=2447956 RepID=A0A4S4MN71_9APHY|nr:hypothetical protein EUX98_g7528 [Antrodiella citrinella]